MQRGRSERVQVCVRTRPTNDFAEGALKINQVDKSIQIHLKKADEGAVNNKQEDWGFQFNNILHNASQKDVYDACASDVVESVLEGVNGTLLAYGQTGAGKTFTMIGTNDFKDRGIAPRAIAHVFRSVENRSQYSVTIRVSYLEVYMENYYDLLDEKGTQLSPLAVQEDVRGNVVVKGLKTVVVETEEDALKFLFQGEANRAVAAHAMNRQSSRSHCIFSVMLEQRSKVESSAKVITSKLNIVDLAGSERVGKTGSTGLTLKEAKYINKSLTFLEQAVNALASKHRVHVPFRQSKLTNVLRDSIAGNCKTRLIANIWCEAAQLDETISTMRFATRMMKIVNTTTVNVTMDPLQLAKKYKKEIQELKQELNMHDTLANRGNISYDPFTPEEQAEIGDSVQAYIRGDILDINLVNVRQIKEVFKQFKNHILDIQANLNEQGNASIDLKIDTVSDPAAATTTTADDAYNNNNNNSNVQYVGDIDETSGGFHVGSVDASSRPNTIATPQRYNYPLMSPSSGNEYNNNNNDQDNNNNTSRRLSGEFNNTFDSFPASDVGGPQAPGSPSKSSAFYDYKQTDTGAILADEAKLLKQSLRTKKAQLKAETLDTNSLTREIRGLTGAIQRKQLLREDQDKQGEVEVIDEEEFKLIQQCKQQKKAYAAVYTQRKLTVTQVEQLKVRSQDAKVALMNGFLSWYTDKYGEEDVAVEQQHNVAVVEDGDQLDDGEKFAALEERRIMDTHPESLSFYNAKKQMSSTLKKKKRLKGARKPLASSIRPRMK